LTEEKKDEQQSAACKWIPSALARPCGSAASGDSICYANCCWEIKHEPAVESASTFTYFNLLATALLVMHFSLFGGALGYT